MGKFRSTMAQQIAQAACTFEQVRTDNHVPKSGAIRSQRTIGERIARSLLGMARYLAGGGRSGLGWYLTT